MWSYSEFRLLVLALCLIHSASETSGRRTIKRARGPKVRSTAKRSRHLWKNEKGEFCGAKATDLALDTNKAANRKRLMRDARACGLVAIDEGDHVHVHDQPGSVRR